MGIKKYLERIAQLWLLIAVFVRVNARLPVGKCLVLPNSPYASFPALVWNNPFLDVNAIGRERGRRTVSRVHELLTGFSIQRVIP